MKDPAFLFYYQDWLVGTYFLNRREKGAYMDLLCYQADKGVLTLQTIKEILNGDFDCWEKLKDKFIENEGIFYNKRLQIEKEKRAKHSEHQRENINKRWNKVKYDGNTVVIPLEIEDDNEDVINNRNREYILTEFSETFTRWLKYKKDKKQSYKNEDSIKMAYEKLVKLSGSNPETARLIIEQSLANNWNGLFALKESAKTEETPKLSIKTGAYTR